MISVAIIATTLKSIIPECLDSANKLSDDVVIVTNNDHLFINYAEQKNYAVSLCKHEWVLSLDADEVVTPGLIEEIHNLSFDHSAYVIPRENIIFGKVIRHTNWDPNGVLRLFLKSSGKFAGEVHEQWETTGKIGKLKYPIIHYNYSSVEEFIDRMNKYTSLEKKPSSPLFDFCRRYIWHAGFLDGWHGLFLSYLMVIYHCTTWVKKN